MVSMIGFSKLEQLPSMLKVKIKHTDPIKTKDFEIMLSALDSLYGEFLKIKLPEENLNYELKVSEIREGCIEIDILAYVGHFYNIAFKPIMELVGHLILFKDFLKFIEQSLPGKQSEKSDNTLSHHTINNFFIIPANQPNSSIELSTTSADGSVTRISVNYHDLKTSETDNPNVIIENNGFYSKVFFILSESSTKFLPMGFCLKLDANNAYTVSIPDKFLEYIESGKTYLVDLKVFTLSGSVKGYEIVKIHGWE